MAEKSGNFSCHWPPRLFPGHCGPLSGGLSPAIVARSRQDSSACNLPILQAIGKFSLIKTAPVSANNPNQGWLYLGDISKVWARLDGHLWAAGQQLLSEAQMLGAPTQPLLGPYESAAPFIAKGRQQPLVASVLPSLCFRNTAHM